MSAAAAPSQKLLRLDAEIEAESDPVKRGCLKAERAGFRARQGDFDLARAELDALQQDFSKRPDAGVSIRMHIAEGWFAHYSDHPVAAKDHLQRAYALSTAAGLGDLRALSAAWLAHLAYSQDKFEEMANLLRIGLEFARFDDHSTQTRLCLVVAQTLHFADRVDLAMTWYTKARDHAIADSDQAALSALNYNMAGRRAHYMVLASIFNTAPDANARLARIGIESSYSLDNLLGISLVGDWAAVVEAMICSASNEFERAAMLYEKYLWSGNLQGLQAQKAAFIADLAWCQANLGQPAVAKLNADKAACLVTSDMYIEDQVFAFGRLGQTYGLLGYLDFARSHSHSAIQANEQLLIVRAEALLQIEFLINKIFKN